MQRSSRENHSRQIKTHLLNAVSALSEIKQIDSIFRKCPREARQAMELAAESILAALSCLDASPQESSSARDSVPVSADTHKLPAAGPTHQQGQFLAYIRAYMNSNYAHVAPTYAALQKYSSLTAPSVNSMLIRLAERGFISRIPGKARAIQLIIDPEDIPPLDRPFKM
jgi:hypothetical protein